jgi:hypothetical protein
MSWRPKQRPGQLSIHEFKGLADANPNLTKGQSGMTDLQMAAELEKRGWNVEKTKK